MQDFFVRRNCLSSLSRKTTAFSSKWRLCGGLEKKLMLCTGGLVTPTYCALRLHFLRTVSHRAKKSMALTGAQGTGKSVLGSMIALVMAKACDWHVKYTWNSFTCSLGDEKSGKTIHIVDFSVGSPFAPDDDNILFVSSANESRWHDFAGRLLLVLILGYRSAQPSHLFLLRLGVICVKFHRPGRRNRPASRIHEKGRRLHCTGALLMYTGFLRSFIRKTM